ncbi:hypothetical protein X551_04363 [Methylibium sp. T29]|nr:hypothetical protein X551_04363 [Methylibium sp. T29]
MQRAVALEREQAAVDLLAAEEQVHGVDGALVGRQHHAALHQVLELADVARPVVGQHRVDRAAGEAAHAPAVALVELVQEVVHEHRDVLAPLAQRRHPHRQHVEAEEQVLAEAAGLDLLAQVQVAGRHHAHVDLARLRAAHALDLALLQRAQQLALRGPGQDADLVEEQRAAVGALEAAGPVAHGAGVGALLHPEQLGLHQLFGDGRAVDGDEGPGRARADAVQAARQHLLAHAALALEQHGGLGVGGAADHVAHRVEAGRHAHHVLAAEQRARLRRRRGAAVGGAQAAAQAVGLQRAQVVVGVLPVLDRAADDHAVRCALRAALHLAEHHRPAHEAADEARGIAHLLPARHVGADAVEADVLFGLGRAVPVELAVEAAVLLVHVEPHRLDARHALQHVQLRADQHGLGGVGGAAQLAREVGVVRAGVVAHARDQAARAIDAQALDQLLPQHALTRHVHQQHALLVEPDAAFARVEVDARHEVVDRRRGGALGGRGLVRGHGRRL